MKRLAFGDFQRILLVMVVAAAAAQWLLPVSQCPPPPTTADADALPAPSTDACIRLSAISDRGLREP